MVISACHNGVLSDPFKISNGTRQGCPLSPLLFVLSLEPFLCKIHLNPDLSGLTVGHSQQKVSAYADDILFYLTNPFISIPKLLHKFKIDAALSNLKINFTKSKPMGVGVWQPLLLHIQAIFKPKWMKSALKYLATFIPPTFSQHDLNYPPLLKTVRTLLNKWHTGPHS